MLLCLFAARCLDKLFASDLSKHKHEVYVLNNYGTLIALLPARFRGRVKILDNLRRPDWSTGDNSVCSQRIVYAITLKMCYV